MTIGFQERAYGSQGIRARRRFNSTSFDAASAQTKPLKIGVMNYLSSGPCRLGVGEDDKLSHDGGEGDFGRLSLRR
jgi:hypothetical protein